MSDDVIVSDFNSEPPEDYDVLGPMFQILARGELEVELAPAGSTIRRNLEAGLGIARHALGLDESADEAHREKMTKAYEAWKYDR